MTETARRLRRLGAPHARARALAVVLGGLGAALAAAALGLALSPAVSGVTLAWALIVASAGAAAWAVLRTRHEADAPALGRLIESAAGGRAGSIVGVVSPTAGTGTGSSAALLLAADTRAAAVVSFAAPDVASAMRRTTLRRISYGTGAAVTGVLLFLAGSPASGRAAAFWHPLRTWRDARAPVRLVVDQRTVRRGSSVTATITVPGAVRVTLWIRGPGEPWKPQLLALDANGSVVQHVGPIESDLYLRASSGGRSTAEIKIDVALPAFLADLGLTARFPSYLNRSDEPLLVGPDVIPLPAGTIVLTSGSASVPLASAAWTLESRVEPLHIAGTRIDGRFTPPASGTWRLRALSADGSALEGVAPELHLLIVPDSAPIVMLPVPGRDTTLPISLHQQLVADIRDDHGITRAYVVSWRVSRTGRVGEAVRESLDVSGVGDRAIVQGRLDAEQRGLLPGDTLRLYVEAFDNAPTPHSGRSAEIALRLPSMEELRAQAREAAHAVASAADSVSAAQRELSDRTRDLAQERSRDPDGRPAGRPDGRAGTQQNGAMSFQSTQRAEEIARDQAAMSQRVQELAQAVEEIARAAKAAGVDDSAFQNRLREVQELLQRALTPELEQRLRELQEALARLDPEATRQALQRLAEAQQELRRELERSQELFKRAALEGELASLAKDAEDLQRRQAEWNKDEAQHPDSAAAAAERDLATATDSLARGVERAGQTVPLQQSQAAARRAQGAMQEAANAASQRDSRGARASGQEAADSLAQLPNALRQRRDSLASAWRQETLDALNRALAETAALARRQQEVADALRDGEAGAATRARQAAVEEGTHAIEQEIDAAAGRHALVSPQLEAALGYAQNQMKQAREQLEQGDPSPATAAPFAEQALDALNATAHALVRTAERVAGAQSGSGFQEALEQLARMAQQQQGMNGDAQGLLPMMGASGDAVMQRLRELAGRQRQLAEQLERLQAGGDAGAAGALAQEARELARQLEAGRLDRRTIERQERLYHKLLDAGRSLSGDEPDEQKERTSRSATGDSVHIPGALLPGATGTGPKVRYPTWDELTGLTPEQRRMVLEYFRRLNEQKH
ncbi:MAG: hypothetical protein DMD58_09565 [Gemmatimonadetes bacterium]|nr:MAG: hypothetical protein DMD58_09565 [Gemmatimonadota bacterium]